MGCVISTLKNRGGCIWNPANIGEVAVFVPGLRIPTTVDFHIHTDRKLSKDIADRLSALRAPVVALVSQEAAAAMKPLQRKGSSHLFELLQALEEYLPILVALAKGSQSDDKVQFHWINQEDDVEETSISSAWFEILSILHLMALVCFLQANLLLLPIRAVDGYQSRISENGKCSAIDILLKGAGYLNCAVLTVIPQISSTIRRQLPLDLSEEVLRALCHQALGQCVDIQLGMAIDSPKATLAVKRRLACEMMKCWNQAESSISQISFTSAWGHKHHLFVKWKTLEAKAAAYYYHGLILDEVNTEESHGMAAAYLRAADEFLKDSKRTCEAFHLAAPLSRSSIFSGSMKYLQEMITKDALNKVHINLDFCTQDRIFDAEFPMLPDFELALKPDEYHLPSPEPLWEEEAILH